MEGQIQIEAPSELGFLASKIPASLSKVDPTEVGKGGADLTAAQKTALLEQQQQQAQQSQQGQQDPKTQGQQQQAPEETEEQIQAKLDELAKKEEKDLTPEEKEYITKYTTSEETAIDTAKNSVTSKYGIVLAEKSYEDSPQGLLELVDDVAPQVAERLLIEHFETIPMMREFYEHVREGRGIETFLAKNQKPAFEAIELKEVTSDMDEDVKTAIVNNQKQLIRTNLLSRGVPADDVENLIDVAEASGKLYDRAKIAKEALQKTHREALEAKLKAEEDRLKDEELAIQEQARKVETMFNKNDFDGIALPADQLKIFRDAVFKQDGQGRSLLDYKRAKLTLGQRMFIDYLVFTDFKGVNTVKKATEPKKFTFSKAAKENDKRAGGRLTGANGMLNNKPNIDSVKDFLSNVNLNKP